MKKIAIPVINTIHTLEAVEYPEDASEVSTVSLMCVLSEVADERHRQDKKWGVPEHDDKHNLDAWAGLIWDCAQDLVLDGDFGGDARKMLVEIAALSVATIQSMDRQQASQYQAAACTDGLRPAVKYGPVVEG